MNMGDRICLRFTDGEGEISPTLYAHWYGRSLLGYAKAFWQHFHGKIRTEPSNWMVNFIAWLRDDPEDGGLYLYKDDDSASSPDDNGYWEFNTRTGECIKIRMGDFDGGEPIGTEYEEEEDD